MMILFIGMCSVCTAETKYKSIFDSDFYLVHNFSDGISTSSVFNISVICPGNECLKGDTIIFNLTLNNYATNYLEIHELWLVDADTGQNITSYNASKLTVDSTKPLKIALTTTIQNGPGVINLTYFPCLRISLSTADEITREKYGLERTICYKQLFNTIIAVCNTSLMCLSDESCMEYDCRKVSCPNCSYIANHSCYSYQCCKSEDCAYNATCENHQCEEFNCKFYEHIENHECTVLYCDINEQYVNQTCVKLTCSYDEYADNHRCRKLDCKDYEVMGNHSCIPLQCADVEQAINHSCQKLDCREDEAITNHTCQKLSCVVYKYPKDHVCNVDIVFIKSFFSEIAVWTLIIIFLYLIEHIYKKRHKVAEENIIVKEEILRNNK